LTDESDIRELSGVENEKKRTNNRALWNTLKVKRAVEIGIQ